MLRLLDETSYAGRPVTGERSQSLLAALAAAHGRAVVEADLVDAVWGPDDRPANPAKALQVVVSRTRSQTAADVVLRVDHGYRLGVTGPDLDVACLAQAVREAVRAEAAGDTSLALDRARSALGQAVAAPGADLPAIDSLRDDARRDRATATAVLGRSLAALGDHDEAFALLVTVPEPDETTLAALLRSEAVVHGAPAALARYEAHREGVRDRLGIDPGPTLQAVHASLLAADNPVRTGVRFEATSLVGRDDDVRRLRALVRESRVTSILGPGGLGKTRLAHLLGREAEQSVVHFVELAGVASPDDVVSEVGSALGVRDSVSGRRVMTPEQRADVRGRIAQQLDQVPTLLVLDNCEHVIDAVADLVAPLVAATRDLRVVTTTRAPLGIAAERVFALGQLGTDAAAELFRQRAEAARPGVRLDDDVVRRVVSRLDGLPLAIELAAAKVRAMSVVDIDRRLDDRFALLRGNDRGAPDRHQTLLAVIDWSWNLLGDTDRRALRRLSVFHDGFALDGADALLGHDAMPALESLAGQSLVTVRDDGELLRYRMLETVREFGRDRLAEADEEADARAALRAWALDLTSRSLLGLYGVDQVAVVRALAVEENNLADVLREALGADDPEGSIFLVAALGGYWTIRGEHQRVIAVLAAFEEVLDGWDPPADLVDTASRAAGVLVMNTAVAEMVQPPRARALLDRYGPGSSDAGTRALVRLMSVATDIAEPDLLVFADDPDRQVAMLALQWASHGLENNGDPEAAAAATLRAIALWREEDGVWTNALQHTQLAGLYAQLGRIEEATRHADAGLSVLDALEADDDAIQLRAVLAYAAILDGRLDDAQRFLDEMTARRATGMWGGTIVVPATRAELALARGETDRGLELFDEAVAHVRVLRFPGFVLDEGFEPWTLFAESAAIAAQARHGTAPGGDDLHRTLLAKAVRALDPGRGRFDYPVVGCVLFGLGAWALLREDAAAEGIELVALAERFAYSRYAPSMAWEPMAASAETIAPGELGRVLASYDGRRGADVLEDARAAVAALQR
ncbi:BTAD domain-containing putative transcriptional regulator [Nocardioides sp.]|uniref:ATP-binding protein n=1 Tax=Nocardioides sp. TaxID=35761 RepID=UPI00271CE468|nr:BTAD domain-containing putative transcriptional regulator [Nocardioides sp.]MDO9454842.1 BTAD domain-containing putative transcriptional regulator [Nocardioides sp.]